MSTVDPKVQEILDRLRDSLPVIFARERVGELLGGLITPTRMRDLDCRGKGPKRGRVQLNNKKVGYEREAFLEWLAPQLRSKDAC